MRIRKETDFISFFDEKTGGYFRTGVLRNGKDTGIDPFMASFPELLDVGIMGHCIHGKRGLCIKAGIECYQNGLESERNNMSVDDFREIARQCSGNTYQFALGGCGDPDQHEEFEAILGICRDYGIIPNFTTSGFGITKELAAICKEFCGAVAVSWYRDEYTTNAINTLIEAGVKTNIHYVLTKDTVLEALWRLKNSEFTAGVNAIIFLLHKPVGMGTAEKVITIDDSQFRELLDYIENRDFRFKIGFDSCSVPALIRDDSKISDYSLDTCEGARWSAYITPDMKMLPCSFDNQAQKWAVDLRKKTILEAWNSPQFEDFRNCFRSACPHCPKRDMCMGGCPICPEIVLCSEKSA